MITNPIANIKKPSGGADAAAEQRQSEILATKDNLTVNGTKYYISSKNGNDSLDGRSPETAWKTLSKLRESRGLLKFGDGVFFERGSFFRAFPELVKGESGINSMIWTVSGVSYGAYGEGAKPVICGSARNYAECEWRLHKENIWKIPFKLLNAGIVIFNGEKYIGVKKWGVDELTQNGDFYHDDREEHILYLYCDKGSPSTVFEDIEIGAATGLISICKDTEAVVIDNLCIKYAGAHAIGGSHYLKNITVTNCEICWGGGSFFPEDYEFDELGRRVRFGNGIEIGGFSSDILLQNNWVHQIYDAGLTFQSGGYNMTFKDIAFKDNLIQNCNYSIEFFMRRTPEEEKSGKRQTTGVIENIELSGNIMQFAGYGVCEQRPSRDDTSHICGWITDVGEGFKNVVIENNVFDLSSHAVVRWECELNPEISIRNNSFYMKSDFTDMAMLYGPFGKLNAKNQAELEKAVAVFDSSPLKVKWLD